MKVFLTVSAVLALIFGFALLVASSAFYAPMGTVVPPAIDLLITHPHHRAPDASMEVLEMMPMPGMET
jgi:hypothetical protein